MDELVVGRHANHADQKGMNKLVKQLERIAKEDGGYMSAKQVADAFMKGVTE